MMDFLPLTQTLTHALGSLQSDGNEIAALAVLLGAVLGWYLGNYREQLKAKRARAARKSDVTRRERH
jgi:hypothetical protein